MYPVSQGDEEQLFERLLSGRARPDDLDGRYGAVACLLRAAAADEDRSAPGRALLRELTAARVDAPGPELQRRRRKAAAALALAAVVGLGATGAAAANGSLPEPAQAVAHDVAGTVGIDIPDAPGRSNEAPGRPAEPGRPVDPGRSDEAPGRPETTDVGTGVGPGGVPPGQGGTIPGNGSVDAGRDGVGVGGVPPGQGGVIPGNGGVIEATPDDDGDTSPGAGGVPPGAGVTVPANGGAPEGGPVEGPPVPDGAPGDDRGSDRTPDHARRDEHAG